jgi:3-hydroxyisobutyrate dehydrogenase
MGTAIGQRLNGLGHELTVWNRTAEKTGVLSAAGAKAVATPANVAENSEVIITTLTDATAIDATYLGQDGLLSGNVTGKLFSRWHRSPETEKALASKVRKKGAAFVECPVGGTVGPARDGKLFGFLGSDATDVARARKVLDQLCRRVEHVGLVGAGASMKLAINLPLLVFWQAFGEALALCRPLRLDAARIVEIFSDTSGAPNALKNRAAVLAAVIDGKDAGAITVDIDSMRKDLRTMLEEARRRRASVTARTLDATAARAQGWAKLYNRVPY